MFGDELNSLMKINFILKVVKICEFYHLINNLDVDFPGGLVVKNLPSNRGDSGSILGQGTKIPLSCRAIGPTYCSEEPSCWNEDPPRCN